MYSVILDAYRHGQGLARRCRAFSEFPRWISPCYARSSFKGASAGAQARRMVPQPVARHDWDKTRRVFLGVSLGLLLAAMEFLAAWFVARFFFEIFRLEL